MSHMKLRRSISIGLLLGVGLLALAAFTIPRMVRKFFYPPAPQMPAMVSKPVNQILDELEAAMKAKAPTLLENLRPGLTSDAITALERQSGIQLPEDIRALYRWRNGCRSSDPLVAGPIPGFRF